MFGQVQSRLFPMYFATTLLLSAVTLVTYTIRNPYENWTTTDWKLVRLWLLITNNITHALELFTLTTTPRNAAYSATRYCKQQITAETMLNAAQHRCQHKSK